MLAAWSLVRHLACLMPLRRRPWPGSQAVDQRFLTKIRGAAALRMARTAGKCGGGFPREEFPCTSCLLLRRRRCGAAVIACRLFLRLFLSWYCAMRTACSCAACCRTACRVLPVVCCVSCIACPVLPVLYCLSCTACPLLPFQPRENVRVTRSRCERMARRAAAASWAAMASKMRR